MTSVREIMTEDATCVGENDTIVEAAQKMRDLEVGALPICGEDDRLKGMITDRDVAIQIVAESKDPSSVRVRELAQGEVVTIGADDSIQELIRTMSQYAVRRVPVIDGHRLVGIVSQADVARSLPEDQVGELVNLISGAPSND
jgi:CBS domain-containing protein